MAQSTATVFNGRRLPTTRRGLLFKDGLTFVMLLLVTGALFGMTLFLFRSFESHREELARRWSSRGMAAISAGRPADAIGPLRAALSYAPDETDYQLLLADALAGAGKTDQAINYYQNLWETRQGDAYINLQLARLMRRKGDAPEAINYYRSAVNGGWKTNGIEARRGARLELADYLNRQHDSTGARGELLIAAANAPSTVELNTLLADRLWQVGDTEDALNLYRKALVEAPRSRPVLEHTGLAEFGAGNYSEAARLLRRARDTKAVAGEGGLSNEQLEAKAHEAERTVELSLSRELPAHIRAEHLESAGKVAEARLDACIARATPSALLAVVAGHETRSSGTLLPPPPTAPAADVVPQTSPLLELQGRWKAAETRAALRALKHDAAAQDGMTALILATEQQTSAVCGAAAGDDAVLLKMAGAAESAGKAQ